jgi:hypothetical protein
MKIDPLSSQVLQLLKQTPARVLVIGGFAFEASLLGRDGTLELASLEEAEKALAAGAEPFDTVLWRADRPAGLDLLSRLLLPRGRLVVVVPLPERRELLLELLRLGFVFLEEHEVNLLTSKVRAIALRREDFSVRALLPGEESAILELFAPSFHVQRSVDHWRWKYENNPWGGRNVTVARSPEGELAAHYAGYPLPLVQVLPGGRRRDQLAMQIGDTMTDPRFRQVGRGPTSLLGRCIRHYYTAFCEDRVAFNFGFNTGNIQKFSMLFAGAHRIEPVGYWLRPAAPPPPAGGYRTTRVMDPGAAFERFFDRVAEHYGLLVRRDPAYLRWRYLDCPDQPPFVLLAAWRYFRLVGYAVFRRRGDHLAWADALFDPHHLACAGDLLWHALALPENQGVTAIEAWFPPRPGWFWPRLSALGFSARPEPHDLSLMLVPHQECDAPNLVRELFYYTLGDGDLV